MITVYLAGGFHGNWQAAVMAAVPDARFINPQGHGLKSAPDYAVWDRLGINMADVVFAFMSRDNPSGLGLAAEVGYAVGLGKIVILVDETDNKYMELVRNLAGVWYTNFGYGLGMLRSMANLYARIDE